MNSTISRKIFSVKILAYNISKFEVGSGLNNLRSNWFLSDINILDVCNERNWKQLLIKTKLSHIKAEHVWEHLDEDEVKKANLNCFNFLKPKGILRIAVPDGYHIDNDYINYVKPGGTGPGADNHKILFNYHTLKNSLESAGFSVIFLEHWDELGCFHFTEWDDDGGRIKRSIRYDERNKIKPLSYTSLIVDAIKP